MFWGRGNALFCRTITIFQANPHTQVAPLEFKATGHDFVLTLGVNDIKMKGNMVQSLLNLTTTYYMAKAFDDVHVVSRQGKFDPGFGAFFQGFAKGTQQTAAAEVNGISQESPMFIVPCHGLGNRRGSRHPGCRVDPEVIASLRVSNGLLASKRYLERRLQLGDPGRHRDRLIRKIGSDQPFSTQIDLIEVQGVCREGQGEFRWCGSGEKTVIPYRLLGTFERH